MCLLYPDCSAIDETCTNCVSGQFSCLLDDPEPKGKPENSYRKGRLSTVDLLI
jgi:hypothetical protein